MCKDQQVQNLTLMHIHLQTLRGMLISGQLGRLKYA